MKIHVEDLEGKKHILDAVEGWSVMEILRDYGFPIKAECGGACCCATCHVYVDPAWAEKIHPKEDDEDEMLDEAQDVEDNSRLSCQIIMDESYDGLAITLAKNPD